MVFVGPYVHTTLAVHGRTVDVAPFDPSLGFSKKIPIVDAAVA